MPQELRLTSNSPGLNHSASRQLSTSSPLVQNWCVGVGGSAARRTSTPRRRQMIRNRPSASLHLVGVVSDTHGLIRPDGLDALWDSDLIVHCGDLGDSAVLEALGTLAPVRAIRGNNNTGAWASGLPTNDVVEVGSHTIYVLHNLAELELDPDASAQRQSMSRAAETCHTSENPQVEPRQSEDGVRWLPFRRQRTKSANATKRFTRPLGVRTEAYARLTRQFCYRYRGFESSLLQQAVSGLRHSPGELRKLRACSGNAHGPSAPENAQMGSRGASLRFSLCGRVIRCRCRLLAFESRAMRWALRAFDGRKASPEHRLLRRHHAS